MSLTTQFHADQAGAQHVVEVDGRILTAFSYDAASNTVSLPARGVVTVPIDVAIAANKTIDLFCSRVMDLFRPSMAYTKGTKLEFESEPEGLHRCKFRLVVGLDVLSEFTIGPDGKIAAAARSVGPIPFPEFFWSLRATTRTFRYCEALMRGDSGNLIGLA